MPNHLTGRYPVISVILAVAVSVGLVVRSSPSVYGDSGDSGARPNFVFVLADDLGWGDLACYGHQTIRTPNIDRLAEEGIRFTQFYVCSGVCSPSRAAFLTGHFPARDGIHGALGSAEKNRALGMPDFLDPALTTLPRLLRQGGYATGHFGKWHLSGGPDGPLPSEYGFDSFASVAHLKDTETREVTYKVNRNGAGWEPVPPEFAYDSTRLIVDDALEFIKANRSKPFYVQLWLHDVHARLQPTPEQKRAYPDLIGALQIYYAAVTNMDRHIGTLLAGLDDLGLGPNTIVILSSDNGPEDIVVRNAAEHGVGSSGPFRGRKRSLYEGGIRVPLIVRWPGVAPAGVVDETSVISGVDFLESLCSLANVNAPANLKLDGVNVADAFRGQCHERTAPLMWEYRFGIPGHPINVSPILAIRNGKWKLLMNPDRSRVELYDLSCDPGEVDNRADQHQPLVMRLASQLLDWQSTLPKGPMQPGVGSNDYPRTGR